MCSSDLGEIVIAVLRPSVAWIAARSSTVVCVLVLAALVTSFDVGIWPASSWYARACLAGAGLRVVVASVEWASRVYVLTDRRVLRRRGVLSPTVYSAQLNALRRVELLQDSIDRVLGTGTITFSTRTEGRYEAAWLMVSRGADVLAMVEEARRRYGR